eukprot:8536_1
MARFKKFLHHSCMLAVCVTVVLHSLPVGVGAAMQDTEEKAREPTAEEKLNWLKKKLNRANAALEPLKVGLRSHLKKGAATKNKNYAKKSLD